MTPTRVARFPQKGEDSKMTKKSEREREQERRANMPGPNGKEARVIARRLIAPEISEDERSEAGGLF